MNLLAIHGMPRSGTTWLGSIFDSSPESRYLLQPLFSLDMKGMITEKATKAEIEFFKTKLMDTRDPFATQTATERAKLKESFNKNSPTFLCYKETRYHSVLRNLLLKDDKATALLIIRDPVEAIESWYNAPKEFNPQWSIQDEWYFARKKRMGAESEYYGLESWIETTTLFENLEQLFQNRVRILRYEHLIENPMSEMQSVFEFFNHLMFPQTIDFISRSSLSRVSTNPYSTFFKGRKSLKKYRPLPQDISNNIIHMVQKSGLEKYLKSV